MSPKKIGIMEHHGGTVLSKGCGSYYVINMWMMNIRRKKGKKEETEGKLENGKKGRWKEMKEEVSCDGIIFLSLNCISFPKASFHCLHNPSTSASAPSL